MIMADQDHDGSHIKGLVINFIHHYWPTLFRKNGFLVEFVTPLVKIFKKSDPNNVIPFFTQNDFKKFAEENDALMKSFRIKYYKGLGTSDNAEAQEYFEKLQRHKIEFFYEDSTDDGQIQLAFCKKMADARKDWLTLYDPNVYVDHTINRLRYKDFVDKELMAFSIANNERAIPNIMDGLKTGQRKILFGCFKRNLTVDTKVAQLVGYIGEHTAYHHGEMSLASTIVGLA
jgi:DNA topoisomerase-2